MILYTVVSRTCCIIEYDHIVNQNTVIVFSDQVPIYLTTGKVKNWIAPFERGGKYQKTKRIKGTVFKHNNRVKLMKVIKKGMDKRVWGSNHLRGYWDKNQGKTRFTFEVGVAVHNYFAKDGSRVYAELIDPFLVVVSSPQVLDLVGPDGKYTDTHQHYSGDHLTIRRKNQNCAALKEYINDRNQHPDDYKYIRVLSNETATINDISYSRVLQHYKTKYPQALEIRDCMGVCHSPSAKVQKYIYQIIGGIVPPLMTDIMQIGDTDLHKSMKDSATQVKEQLQYEANITASAKTKGPALVQKNARNIMRVARAMRDRLYELVNTDDAVIKGLYKTGYFAYRPGPDGLYNPKDKGEEWCQKYEMGRDQVEKDWYTDRYKWLDENGVPQKPDWTKMNKQQDGEPLYNNDEDFQTWQDQAHKPGLQVHEEVLDPNSGKVLQVPLIDLDFPRADEFVQFCREHSPDWYKYKVKLRNRDRKAFQCLDIKDFQQKVLQVRKKADSSDKVQTILRELDAHFAAAVHEDLGEASVISMMQRLIPRGPGKKRAAGRQKLSWNNMHNKDSPTDDPP